MAFRFRLKRYHLLVLAIFLVGGIAYALWNNNKTPSYIDKPQSVSSEEVKQTETAGQSNPATSTQPDQNLPLIVKPLLSKSSGNAAPVPAKANIQFVCSGITDASCVVTLINLDNSADNLQFEAKTIKDDGRGNLAVSWIWEAKPGTWSVKATLSKSGYRSNSSDTQTLKVNP